MIKRTSLNLDTDLVADARGILETRGTTDTIHRALEEVSAATGAEERFEDLTPEALERLRATGSW